MGQAELSLVCAACGRGGLPLLFQVEEAGLGRALCPPSGSAAADSSDVAMTPFLEVPYIKGASCPVLDGIWV